MLSGSSSGKPSARAKFGTSSVKNWAIGGLQSIEQPFVIINDQGFSPSDACFCLQILVQYEPLPVALSYIHSRGNRGGRWEEGSLGSSTGLCSLLKECRLLFDWLLIRLCILNCPWCRWPLRQAGGGRAGALLDSFLLLPGSCRSCSFPLRLRLSLQLHPGCQGALPGPLHGKEAFRRRLHESILDFTLSTCRSLNRPLLNLTMLMPNAIQATKAALYVTIQTNQLSIGDPPHSRAYQ